MCQQTDVRSGTALTSHSTGSGGSSESVEAAAGLSVASSQNRSVTPTLLATEPEQQEHELAALVFGGALLGEEDQATVLATIKAINLQLSSDAIAKRFLCIGGHGVWVALLKRWEHHKDITNALLYGLGEFVSVMDFDSEQQQFFTVSVRNAVVTSCWCFSVM